MSSDSSDIFISDIDKERFGVKTARVIGLTTHSLPAVMDFCAQEKIALLIARCNLTDLEAAQAMEKDGFLLMDTLIYYCLDLMQKVIPVDNGAVRVRPIRIDEEDEMILVAAEAFRGYFGHYHSDQQLDNIKCDEAYVDWARKAFVSRQSDNFLVGEINGKIVGFAVLRINTPEEGEMFLGGVHPDFQGQGIYHSCLCKAVQWCLSKKAKRLIISTQLRNIPVQKVLIRFGFDLSMGYYTYHKWFD